MAVESMSDLCDFMSMRLDNQMGTRKARVTAAHYVETLALIGYNYTELYKLVLRNHPLIAYGYLLDSLRSLDFDKYPKKLSALNLETHLLNIGRLTQDYFAWQPIGGHTDNQLPPRQYVLVAVSVDTAPVDEPLIVWQLSLHIPGLSDSDYECLMLPHALWAQGPTLLAAMGYAYDTAQQVYYHQSAEFGRRRVDTEEEGLEKLTNYLNEIRSGLHGASPNNGLVLLFETGEDLALMQQLFSRHDHLLFLDVVKGVTCLDHYRQATSRSVTYSEPSYQFRRGASGCWTSTIEEKGKIPQRIEAVTKSECIYHICQSLLGMTPTYHNFIKLYSYPINHTTTRRLTAMLDHLRELRPLQQHIEQQLVTHQLPIVLKGLYGARNEVETPHRTCARQTIRRLLFLGFTWTVLLKIFRAEPQYEIPLCVFLQDMNEVHKLQVFSQTEQIRGYIQTFVLSSL